LQAAVLPQVIRGIVLTHSKLLQDEANDLDKINQKFQSVKLEKMDTKRAENLFDILFDSNGFPKKNTQ